MVYDWFNRSAAPQNPEEPQPEQPAQPPAAEEQPAASAPTAAAPPAVGAVDQDALEWARQAYARLKAQQEAEKQAAAAPIAASPSAPAVAPSEPVAAQEAVQSEQPVQVEAPVAPAPVAEPEPPAAAVTPVQKSVQTVQNLEYSAVDEPQSPEPQPAAGLSLLEQAAAQRAQRQQELLERAIDAPAPSSSAASTAPAPAAAPAEADEAAPELGAFDDDFTWSAEVLAAQGRNLDDISLEEIDWLGRLRRGMEKTRRGFVTQLLDNLGDDPLTPEVLDDLESLLLRADVGVQATDQVLEALRKRLNEEVVEPAEGIRFLKEQLKGLLDAPIQASGAQLLAPERGRLNVWLMVGVNGVGKTTTLGKLANLAVRSGYSCLIAAADTFRAAAVQQVAVWGERSGVTVVSNPSANADPAAVVFDAIGAAQAKGTDLVLVDTAGRLQTKHNLMEELSKVRRIVDKLAPDALVQSLLVLDASQGQNGLKQAMAFAQAAGLTGVVITKLDGSSRGGVALAVASEAGLPIRFIGAGEGIRDLRPFNSFEFVEALLAK
ncbi:signal recognition particle-docking protein FtsY [Synechococcus sp. CB0101]|uniref:signal recognition particle-docking protein FtsY n=1 Tax=Synechococcus sp. CB0101 TaxID=232348 RepID=UPI0002D4E4BF|nr:signal recognition particle-docking protein FtsY [Synechococcus sp. CB0101]QCH14964.1 signal recognition particle-docking protein FtsY [Synechococcus sp. CB0101]